MRQNESKIQIACVNWFRLQYPQYLIFSIPNGGSRNVIEAVRLKKEGALAGIPDLQIITDKKVFFVEMKDGKKKPTPNQLEIHDKLLTLGVSTFVCGSFDDFYDVVERELRGTE